MISITATGFIGEKPQLQVITQNVQKCEFDVVWSRRYNDRGNWTTAWERATFICWGDDAERIATSLDKGSEVACTGIQETSRWEDKQTGQKRSKVRYRLTHWIKQYKAPREGAASESPQSGGYRQGQGGGGYNAAPRPQGSSQGARDGYQPRQQPDAPDHYHDDHGAPDPDFGAHAPASAREMIDM